MMIEEATDNESTVEKPEEKTSSKLGKIDLRKLNKGLFIGLVLMLLFSAIIYALPFSMVKIHGDSMYPTMKDGDLVILKNSSTWKRDDFVQFRLPPEWEERFAREVPERVIKRIVAIPGDTIQWDGENFFINGEFNSRVVTGGCDPAPMSIKVPEDHIFVIGDAQLDQTMDSREAFCRSVEKFFVDTDLVMKHGSIWKKWSF